MLPGFRFLFTAIMLSMSILVFGLGAAALLRAAHEEFASNPTWRAPPETMFAQQAEAAAPALAMLQIEPPAAAQKATDDIPAIAATIEAETLKESSVPEAAKSETPVPQSPAQSEATSAQADAPADDTTKITAPDTETRIASSEQAPPPQILPPVSETASVAAAPAAPTQASPQAPPEVDAIATKIAALGGPHVTIKPPPSKAADKKIDESVVKKRLQAKKAAQQRRLAARARLAAQQALELTPPAQQQTFGPFGQPSAQPAAAQRR
jgi:hypothetical protein